MELEPRLVIMAGYASTGKTTLGEKLTREITNAIILKKDAVNSGILLVPKTESPRLLSFEDYVMRDAVLLDDAHTQQTIMGEMWRIAPSNDFYGRHGRMQGVLAMVNLAAENLELGKVPIMDCMPIPDYKRGWVERVINAQEFERYPKYLIHCFAPVEVLFERMKAREAAGDPNTVERDRERIKDLETFRRFVTFDEPLEPVELNKFNHLLLDTSASSPDQCLRLALDFISDPSRAN